MKSTPHILIEEMLFGDYRVQAWDENLSPKLDKEYFCRGHSSAKLTAELVQQDFYPELEIVDLSISNPNRSSV